MTTGNSKSQLVPKHFVVGAPQEAVLFGLFNFMVVRTLNISSSLFSNF